MPIIYVCTLCSIVANCSKNVCDKQTASSKNIDLKNVISRVEDKKDSSAVLISGINKIRVQKKRISYEKNPRKRVKHNGKLVIKGH